MRLLDNKILSRKNPLVCPKARGGKVRLVNTIMDHSAEIVSVRNVTIEGDRAGGNLFGSVLGAIVGSNIGGEDDETTQQVGAVVGTAVGSVVGQNVGESLSRKAGVEIIIKLDTNEREISIVQEMPEDVDYSFRAGDKVRIVRSGGKAG